MDLSQHEGLQWNNGIPAAVPNRTPIDKDLLDPVIQEFFNALLLSGVSPDTDVTQLYQLLSSIRDSSNTGAADILTAYTRHLTDLRSAYTSSLDNFNNALTNTNNALTATLNQAYANINAAFDSIQSQLATFSQTLTGLPFAWPSDSVFPPKWYDNRPVKQSDGSYLPSAGKYLDLCLVCDGSRFDTDYWPMLAKVYPSGVLPDLRDQFIRGWNGTSSVNPDNTPVMGTQQDALWMGVKPGENNGTFMVSGTEQGDANGWINATGCFSALPSTASSDSFAGGHGSHCKHAVYDNQTRVSMNLHGINGMEPHIAQETAPRHLPVTWLVYGGIHPDDLGVGARNS